MSLKACQVALKRVQQLLPRSCVTAWPLEPGTLTATLHLPWCGRTLQWQVSFNTSAPYLAPDFLVDDEKFMPLCGSLTPEQHATLASLLVSWSPTAATKPQAIPGLFSKILAILLSGFNHYQMSAMENVQNDRLQFERSTLPHLVIARPNAPLVDLTDTSEQDGFDLSTTIQGLLVEGKACFSLPLASLDLRKLAISTWGMCDGCVVDGMVQPPTEQQLLDQELKLLKEFRLIVEYPLVEDSRSTPAISLQVPAALQAANCTQQPALPVWDPHSCLMDMLPQVVTRVQPVIDTWATQLLTRQALLEALSVQFGMAPVELNLQAGIGQWAIMWDSCPVLVTVSCSAPASHNSTGGLPPATTITTTTAAATTPFPECQPLITLTNLRMLLIQPGVPAVSKWFRDYPWSPRWPPEEMAGRIITYIRGELPGLLSQGPSAIPVYVPPTASPQAVPSS